MRAHGLDHRVAALLERLLGALHPRLEVAGLAVGGEPGLGDHAGRDVGVLGVLGDRGGQRLGRDDVADAEPRGDRLRERRHRHHALAAVELEERRRRLARPAQEAVRIVLDDHEVVLLGELEDALAPLERHRGAARVLEVRDHVEEGRGRALELGGQRVGVDAVAVDRDADDVGARAPEDQDAAVVGRRLDEHAPRGGAREQHVGHEREHLERAVGADDALLRRAVARADPAAQPGMPAGVVRERDGRLRLHRLRERAAHVVDGEHVGARDATRERDRIGHAVSVRASGPARARQPPSICRRASNASGAGAGPARIAPRASTTRPITRVRTCCGLIAIASASRDSA